MITLELVRAALLAADPFAELDRIVRSEMAAGRTVKDIFNDLNPLADAALQTPGLSDDGEEALLGTFDALTGNCHRDCQYIDPPRTDLPSKAEIAALPRWARVAFAARCVRRVLALAPLLQVAFTSEEAEAVVRFAEGLASSARDAPDGSRAYDFADRQLARVSQGAREPSPHASSLFVAICSADPTMYEDEAAAAWQAADESVRAARVATELAPAVRRDFDHLTGLADWQRWSDNTPVSPEVFGPLWPEGPPPGWPADPGTPQWSDLGVELLARVKKHLEQVTEDEAVNLFEKINAYYVARTGKRLTIEDLRPQVAAGVLAGV